MVTRMNNNRSDQLNIVHNPDNALSILLANGTMTSEDILRVYQNMRKEEILSKYTFPKAPSSDGFYHMAVRDESKKGGRTHFKAKTVEKLKEKVYQFALGKHGDPTIARTFREVFQLVQNEKLSLVKDEQKRVSVQNTIGRNESEYKRFFSGTDFEKMPVQTITKRDVENITLENLKRYNLRKKGYLSMRSILKSVFQYAYSEYWISDNPYLRTDFHKFKDMVVAEVPIEQRAHSEEDVERILSFLHDWQSRKPEYIPAYALEMQILCGLRRGEVPPLLWDDVKDTYLFIHREQLTEKKHDDVSEHFVIVDHTKTYVDRKYPLTKELKAFLGRLRTVDETFYPDSDFLFPAASENGCITNNAIYEFYRRICRKLGIKIGREVVKGTHSFRRNAISKVVNSTDGNLVMASQLFGNSPEVARKNYYTGLDLDKALAVLDA